MPLGHQVCHLEGKDHLDRGDQEAGGLAQMLLEEQIIMGLSGLSDEVRSICLELGLPSVPKSVVFRQVCLLNGLLGKIACFCPTFCDFARFL